MAAFQGFFPSLESPPYRQKLNCRRHETPASYRATRKMPPVRFSLARHKVYEAKFVVLGWMSAARAQEDLRSFCPGQSVATVKIELFRRQQQSRGETWASGRFLAVFLYY